MPELPHPTDRILAKYLADPTLTPSQREFVVRVARETGEAEAKRSDKDIDGELLLQQVLASKGDPMAMPSLDEHRKLVRQRRRTARFDRAVDAIRISIGVGLLGLGALSGARWLWHALR